MSLVTALGLDVARAAVHDAVAGGAKAGRANAALELVDQRAGQIVLAERVQRRSDSFVARAVVDGQRGIVSADAVEMAFHQQFQRIVGLQRENNELETR